MMINGLYDLVLQQYEARGERPEAIVIVCPGGGYCWLSPREGQPVAEAFAENGYHSFVLSYDVSSPVLGKRPFEQIAWAVCRVRQLIPGLPVLLCGFSAGGHLAASLGVHWHELGREYRPDGLILCYPVITAGPFAHQGSMLRLAGTQGGSRHSLERFVNAETPPVFIWHTADDEAVSVQNSLLFAERLAECGVPLEMHIYPRGVHGLSLATAAVEEPEKGRYADAHVAKWFHQCICWIKYEFGGKGAE